MWSKEAGSCEHKLVLAQLTPHISSAQDQTLKATFTLSSLIWHEPRANILS